VCNQDIQVPCKALGKCPVFSECAPYIHPASATTEPRFVCIECLQKQGGHVHEVGQGKDCQAQVDDTAKALKLISHFLKMAATSESTERREKVLKLMIPAVLKCGHNEDNQDMPEPQDVPSFFGFNTMLHQNGINIADSPEATDMSPSESKEFGERMALQLWNSRPALKEKLPQLESPSTLEEYRNAMPQTLLSFFLGFIQVIQEKKLAVANRKRKQRGLNPAVVNEYLITNISVFLVSILLQLFFANGKFGLPM
jgi:hypothetical protein